MPRLDPATLLERVNAPAPPVAQRFDRYEEVGRLGKEVREVCRTFERRMLPQRDHRRTARAWREVLLAFYRLPPVPSCGARGCGCGLDGWSWSQRLARYDLLRMWARLDPEVAAELPCEPLIFLGRRNHSLLLLQLFDAHPATRERQLPIFVLGLTHTWWPIAEYSARVIGRWRGDMAETAGASLVAVLKHPQWQVRLAAVLAIRRLWPPRPLTTVFMQHELSRVSNQDRDRRVRYAAGRASGLASKEWRG